MNDKFSPLISVACSGFVRSILSRAEDPRVLGRGLSGVEGLRAAGGTPAAAPGSGELAEPRQRVAPSAVAANERVERMMAALLRLQTTEV